MKSALLNIHFQVGSLILADALPWQVNFTDNDLKPYDLRHCACLRIVNAVNTALQTDCSKEGTTSILLLDPYPEQMVNALIRTGTSLFSLFAADKISYMILKRMFSVVISALDILAEISSNASTAIPLLRQKFHEAGIGQVVASPQDTIHQAAFRADSLFDAGLVEELEQQANDPSLVSKTVERNENNIFMSSFLSEEIQPTEFDFLSQNWEFDVSTPCPPLSRGLLKITQGLFHGTLRVVPFAL